MYYKLKNQRTKEIFNEILNRMDYIDVRGPSVEQLYMVRLGLKQLIDTLEIVKEEDIPKEEKT